MNELILFNFESYLESMDNKPNDTIDKATRFLELVNRHLKEKNCKHTIVEVAKEFVKSNE